MMPKILIRMQCKNCKKYLMVDEKRAFRSPRFFCSPRCTARFCRIPLVSRKCLFCSKRVLKRRIEVIRNRRSYCSPECQYKAMVKAVTKECVKCGKEILVRRCRLKASKSGEFYCSRSCSGKNKTKGWMQRTCLCCGNIFGILKTKVEIYGLGKCCSRACKLRASRKRIKLNCTICGQGMLRVPTKTGRQYCSRRCYNEDPEIISERSRKMIRRVGRLASNWRGGISAMCVNCEICKKKIVRPLRKNSKTEVPRYACSPKCRAEIIKRFHSGPDSMQWQGGLSFQPYTSAFNKKLKDLIRKRDRQRCVLCRKTRRKNGRPLQVHHIDYDKSNCDPKNLASLCNVCHGRTNTRRKQWKLVFAKKQAQEA